MPDSRRKGRESERSFEKLAERRGIPAVRSLGGREQALGDVLLPGFAVEVRRREKLSLTKWSREHEEKVPDHLTPVVAYRTNNEPWRVSMPAEDFLDLIQAAGR